MYRNLQEFVQRLEREGELIRVKTPVSSRFEIAEITDRMAKSEGGGKALLFENTDGDFPVLTNMMGSSRRIAMALGVERAIEVARGLSGQGVMVFFITAGEGDKYEMYYSKGLETALGKVEGLRVIE